MELTAYFQSVLEQDRAPVVLCDTAHTILYMNRAAIDRYADRGGASLLGKSLLLCHNAASCTLINRTLAWFAESDKHNIVYESHSDRENKDVYLVALRNGDGSLIGYYEKHEYRTPETAQRYDFRTNAPAQINTRF